MADRGAVASIRALLEAPVTRMRESDWDVPGAPSASTAGRIAGPVGAPRESDQPFYSPLLQTAAGLSTFAQHESEQRYHGLDVAQALPRGLGRTPSVERGRGARRSATSKERGRSSSNPQLHGPVGRQPAPWLVDPQWKQDTFGEQTAGWSKGLRSYTPLPSPTIGFSPTAISAPAGMSDAVKQRIDIAAQLEQIKQKARDRRDAKEAAAAMQERRKIRRPRFDTLFPQHDAVPPPVPAEVSPQGQAKPAVRSRSVSPGHCHGPWRWERPNTAQETTAMGNETAHPPSTRDIVDSILATRRLARPAGTRHVPTPPTLALPVIMIAAKAMHLVSGRFVDELISQSQHRRELFELETHSSSADVSFTEGETSLHGLPTAWASAVPTALYRQLRYLTNEIHAFTQQTKTLQRESLHAVSVLMKNLKGEGLAKVTPIQQKCADIRAQMDVMQEHPQAMSEEEVYRFAVLHDLLVRWEQKRVLHQFHFFSHLSRQRRQLLDMRDASIRKAHAFQWLLQARVQALVAAAQIHVSEVENEKLTQNRISAAIRCWRTFLNARRRDALQNRIAHEWRCQRLKDVMFRHLKAYQKLSKAYVEYSKAITPYAHVSCLASKFYAWKQYIRWRKAMKSALVADVTRQQGELEGRESGDAFQPEKHSIFEYVHYQRLRAAADVTATQHIQRARNHCIVAQALLVIPRLLSDGRSVHGARAIASLLHAFPRLQVSAAWKAPVPVLSAGTLDDNEVESAPHNAVSSTYVVSVVRTALRVMTAALGFQVQRWQLWRHAPPAVKSVHPSIHVEEDHTPTAHAWARMLGISESAGSGEAAWEPIPRFYKPQWVALPALADNFANRQLRRRTLQQWSGAWKCRVSIRKVQSSQARNAARSAFHAMRERMHVLIHTFNDVQGLVERAAATRALHAWRGLLVSERNAETHAAFQLHARKLMSCIQRWFRYTLIDARERHRRRARATAFRHTVLARMAVNAWSTLMIRKRKAMYLERTLFYRQGWRAVMSFWPKWVTLAHRRRLLRGVFDKAVAVRRIEAQSEADAKAALCGQLVVCVQHWRGATRRHKTVMQTRELNHSADAFWRQRRLFAVCNDWRSAARSTKAEGTLIRLREERRAAKALAAWKYMFQQRRIKVALFLARRTHILGKRKAFNAWLMHLAIQRRFHHSLAARMFTRWRRAITEPREKLEGLAEWKEKRNLARHFRTWLSRSLRLQYLRDAERYFESRRNEQLQKQTLRQWRRVLTLAKDSRHNNTRIPTAVLAQSLPIRQALQVHHSALPSNISIPVRAMRDAHSVDISRVNLPAPSVVQPQPTSTAAPYVPSAYSISSSRMLSTIPSVPVLRGGAHGFIRSLAADASFTSLDASLRMTGV